MKRTLEFVAMAFFAVAVVSCNGSGGDCFDREGFDAFGDNVKDNISSYVQKDMGSSTAESKKVNVYVDFSNGMQLAFVSKNNQQMLVALASGFSDNATWFRCCENDIQPMNMRDKEIYNMVTDAKNFTKTEAPIEKTLEEIVKLGQDAIFITDFEEYENGIIQKAPFATKHFTKWIKNGNSIHFYMGEDFKEGNKMKRLFFVVFNTPSGSAQKGVNEAWQDRGFQMRDYLLTNKLCIMTTEYPSNKKGGIYYDDNGQDPIWVLDTSKFYNPSNKDFEYYPGLNGWHNLFKYSNDYMQAGTPKPFSHVFRNLFLNLEGTKAYSVEKLGVRVTDVTDDYVFYCKAREALNHKPKLTKDESGNSIFDEGNDEIALTCYDESSGNLKAEWEYEPHERKEVKEVFIIDDELFNNDKAKGEKIEVGVKWHPNFNGSQTAENPNGLYRVDIFIKECKEQLPDLNPLLAWDDNSALAESVRKTLFDVKPEGNVIYSYFIKMY